VIRNAEFQKEILNIAEAELSGMKVRTDVLRDVNETAALVLNIKQKGGKSGIVIWGGGSPKNFMLQSELQIQKVRKINEKGHDFFLQVTDACPDTGGLSGATPSVAMSWGKVHPEKFPDTVVVVFDTTVAMPVLTSYALAKHRPRPLKQLYDRREETLEHLRREYMRA
jgi:deoxyhypusine synthase